jgi:hypothetical protein
VTPATPRLPVMGRPTPAGTSGIFVVDVQHLVMWHVETNYGVELVPEYACGSAPTPERLDTFLRGKEIRGLRRLVGWYGRLCRPERTSTWQGPFYTEMAADRSVRDFFDLEEDDDAP